MADVYDKQSFMFGLEKEIEIVVETDEVSLEELEESEFILEDLPGVVEIRESRTESVMASSEDMVVVGGTKRRKQLTACKNCHRKYSNFSLRKDHENQCGKSANLWGFFCSKCKFFGVTCELRRFIIIIDTINQLS